jgi:hypothetical protein
MWQYNNMEELYHYGVPGMRWGHRRGSLKSRMEFKSYKRRTAKQAKADAKQKAFDKRVKMTDRNVKKIGVRGTKAVNRLAIGAKLVVGYQATKGTVKLTNNAVKSIKNSNLGPKAKLGAAVAARVLGTAVTAKTIQQTGKDIKGLRTNVKLAKDYEYRQYMNKKYKK